MKKRLLSMLLAVIMVVGMLPVNALAAEDYVYNFTYYADEEKTEKILEVKNYKCPANYWFEGIHLSLFNDEHAQDVNVVPSPELIAQYTPEGYVFVGWSYDGETIPADADDDNDNMYLPKGNADLEIFAEFKGKTCKVNYFIDGEKIDESCTLEGEDTLAYNVYDVWPQKTGYILDGWYEKKADIGNTKKAEPKAEQNLSNKGKIDLYGKYNAIPYEATIEVYQDGNKDVAAVTMDMGQWYYDSMLMDNLAAAGLNVADAYVVLGYQMNKFADHVEWDGKWYDSEWNEIGAEDTVEGETTLKIMVYNAYPVYVTDESGRYVAGTVTEENYASFEMPEAAEKTGYHLYGWYQDLGDYDKGHAPMTSLYTAKKWELVAKYLPNTYKVRFFGNGGTDPDYPNNTYNEQTGFVYDKETQLWGCRYKRTGYTFNGWNTAANGSGTDYKQYATVKNLTDVNGGIVKLYAQWKPITYTVVFDNNGGEGEMEPMQFTYDVAQNLTANAFNKKYYEFKGWNTEVDGSGTPYADEESVSNLTAENGATVTLYAQWIDVTPPEVIDYTVASGDAEDNRFVVLIANEPIQSPGAGWSKVTNKYTEDGTKWKNPHLPYGKVYEFILTDLAGNVSEKPYVVDLKVPEVEVSYSTTELTNQDVTVTLTFDEDVTVEGWEGSGNVWTKTFAENTEVTVNFQDLAKYPNKGTTTVKIENIDKVAPKVDYYVKGDNQTKDQILLVANEAIKTPAGWTGGKDPNRVQKMIKRGQIVSVDVYDLAGNKTTVEIDLKAPEVIDITLDPSKITDTVEEGPVVVTITFDELTKITSDGWAPVPEVALAAEDDAPAAEFVKKWFKEFYSNTEETVEFLDAVVYNGTRGSAKIVVDNIRFNLSKAVVTLDPSEYTYDGKAKEPAVTVTYEGNVVDPAHYDVEYKNNVNAGTAFVVVKAKDSSDTYQGEKTVEFTIERRDISDAVVVLNPTSVLYNGRKQTVDVKVIGVNDAVLTEGTDYTVAYSDNENPGLATVTVTGIGNYTGVIEEQFRIYIYTSRNDYNTVTFMDGDCYDLESQKGTHKNKDGNVVVELKCFKINKKYIPDVTAADEYYDVYGWAIVNKDGELEEIDLEDYKFTKSNTKVYALCDDLWKPYSDMNQNRKDWYYRYVRDLSIAGVVNGNPDGTFAPNGNVTWGAALKLIMLATGYEEQAPVNAHWASGYLAKALADGLVTAEQNIDLDASLTRQEYATVAYLAMDLKPSKQDSPFADTDNVAVVALYEAGIIEGSFVGKDRVFNPNDNIDRAQISAVIWRINNYTK